MKYGKGIVDFSIPQNNLLGTLESKGIDVNITEEEVLLKALQNPIGSKKLSEIVKMEDKVCVVVPDITRAWQKVHLYLPYVIEELYKSGVKDENILLISATGAHRNQTPQEHEALLGKNLFHRLEIIDHNAKDKENLVYLGETSRKTPVFINKKAMECQHIILTGGIVFHDLAGWSGGRKSILPGIAGYETIMKNHSLSLASEVGRGSNPMVKCGIDKGNPLQEDMLEAAKLVKPSFMFNVIIGEEGKITAAVAGHYIEAHETGKKVVATMDSVYIEEKADLVITSAGGYPKDINLYQATKAISNGKEALKEGGTLILLSECVEGFGDKEVQDILLNYNNNIEREKDVREKFTVAKYIGYDFAQTASKFNIILVSKIEAKLLKKINVKVVETIEEALSWVGNIQEKDLKTYIMPYGANTLPIYKK